MGSGTQGQLLLFVRLTVGSRDTKMCPRSRFHPRGSIHGLVDPLDPLVWLFGLMELPQEFFAVKRWKRMFQSVGLQRDKGLHGSTAQCAGRGSAAVSSWSSTRRQTHAVAACKDTARPKSLAMCAVSEWQRSAGLSSSTRGAAVQTAMCRGSSEISRSKRRHPHPIPRLGQTAATAGCGFSLSWWFNSTRKQANPSCTKQRMVYGF